MDFKDGIKNLLLRCLKFNGFIIFGLGLFKCDIGEVEFVKFVFIILSKDDLMSLEVEFFKIVIVELIEDELILVVLDVVVI